MIHSNQPQIALKGFRGYSSAKCFQRLPNFNIDALTIYCDDLSYFKILLAILKF